VDLQNRDQLRTPATDNGFVPNVKWSFSQSQTKLFPGGWSREQVIQDLPQSTDIAGAQQHLKKGAIRELHWHRVVGFLEHSTEVLWELIRVLGGVGIRL
jgi:oxalate decarboxylase/phosphoglucose isomerase-like protein (cupin superfamily)